ncbi:MAG: hypothetical protein H8E44_16790 [Planctomycetes bacterium]|nr:hypothetical protein [Planctomycetota bacterium]MBL7038402.1 hypothetical protein [Pirellulaceae bacterium]
MSTDVPQEEIVDFYHFLGHRLENGGRDLTPERSVQEFRLYQQELQRFIDRTQPAIAESERGESRLLDVDALMERVRTRLTAEEVSD